MVAQIGFTNTHSDISHSWLIRQDSRFWSLRQMLYKVRDETMLAVVHFIYFLRILQKSSNILLSSRQNWTTKVFYFLQKKDYSRKFFEPATSHFLLYSGVSQRKLYYSSMITLDSSLRFLYYIIPWWWIIKNEYRCDMYNPYQF